MKPDEHPKTPTLPVDLEIRISSPWGGGDERSLGYVLNSPSGAVDFFQTAIPGKSISAPKTFQEHLFQQLEDLHRGRAVDGETVLKEEIFKDLTSIGHDLYQNLFSREMRRIYRELRDRVKTLLIVSDEPWIPWEILRPSELEDDDFLCMKFQMSRWLIGETPLAHGKRVDRLVAIEPGETTPLTNAREEFQFLKAFVAQTPGVDGLFRSGAQSREIEELLEKTGFDLLHFVGHGRHDEQRPSEAKVILSDRALRARQISPKAEGKLRKDRPVVFLNACQVGRLGRSLADLDGWAPRWVNRYCCSAFLAPFWSVSDERAFLFARLFYDELRKGRTLGQAVLLARHKLRDQDRNEMTWLAYSLHGHPNAQITFGDHRPVLPSKPAAAEAKLRIPVPAEHRSRAYRSPPDIGPAARAPWTTRPPREPAGSSRRAVLGLAAVVSLATLVTVSVVLNQNWRDSQKESAISTPTKAGTEAPAEEDSAKDEAPGPSEEAPRPPASEPAATGTQPVETPDPVEEANPAVPLSPMVSGRVGIVTRDRTTRQADFAVADAIESMLSNKIDNIDPKVIRADAAYVEGFFDGDLSILPEDDRSPWGVEYFLMATTSHQVVPQNSPPLKGVVLTITARLIDVGNRSTKQRSDATHTGLGPSEHAALTQATERCLSEITNTLMERSQP